MKYKEGDRVRILPRKELFERANTPHHGTYKGSAVRYSVIPDMFSHAGKVATIMAVLPSEEGYRLNVDDGACGWDDSMFDPYFNPPDEPLSVEDAAKAMLDGATLYKEDGGEIWYDKTSKSFLVTTTPGLVVYTFKVPAFTAYRHPKRCKREMTNEEKRDWALSKACWGWMVRCRNTFNAWSEWDFPSRFVYEGLSYEHQRARLLPDFSGIDESTIQGFEVEMEEDDEV
jgi:hypothetical protein